MWGLWMCLVSLGGCVRFVECGCLVVGGEKCVFWDFFGWCWGLLSLLVLMVCFRRILVGRLCWLWSDILCCWLVFVCRFGWFVGFWLFWCCRWFCGLCRNLVFFGFWWCCWWLSWWLSGVLLLVVYCVLLVLVVWVGWLVWGCCCVWGLLGRDWGCVGVVWCLGLGWSVWWWWLFVVGWWKGLFGWCWVVVFFFFCLVSGWIGLFWYWVFWWILGLCDWGCLG